MQITSPPRWLMIVSTPIAVLPVPRSPMISSRWPRPIGIIESIALRPVWSGSTTGCRWMTPGALNSSGRRVGLDRPLAVERVAERVDDAAEEPLAHGDVHHRAGAADGLALLDVLPLAEEGDADVVLLEVERDADDAVLELEPLEGDAVLEAVDARDAVADLEDGPDLREIGLDVVLLDPLLEDRGDLFGAELHRGLSFFNSGSGDELAAEPVQAAAHARVDAQRAGLEDEAADQVGVDRAGRLDRAARRLLDLADDRGGLGVVELVGGGQLDRQAALLAVDDRLELLDDLTELARPPLRRDDADEVADDRVCAARSPRRGRSPWRPGRAAGSRGTPRARAWPPSPSASSESSLRTTSTLPWSCAAS